MAISAGGSHTCMQVDKPEMTLINMNVSSVGEVEVPANSAIITTISSSGYAISPQSVYSGFTALNTGITAPNYVNGTGM